MSAQPNYEEILASAEKAVQSVKDPELRRVAFQKILDELLSLGRPADTHKTPKSKKPVIKATAGTKKRKSGTQSYVQELVDEDFFKKPKTISELKAELENRGHHIPLTALSGPLQKLCQRRVLRRNKVKSGKRQTFAYSEW